MGALVVGRSSLVVLRSSFFVGRSSLVVLRSSLLGGRCLVIIASLIERNGASHRLFPIEAGG